MITAVKSLLKYYTNELLDLLQKSMYSLNVYGIKISSIAYADDLSLLALSKVGLQSMLNSVFKYSCKWRFQFNSSKCKLLIFGKKQKELKCCLGNKTICVSECDTVLGVPFITNPAEEVKYYLKVVNKCKSIAYATQAIGSHVVPITPITFS